MTNERPASVGLYRILQDYQSPSASVRVFRMQPGADAIAGHVHHRSNQVYVALEGTVIVEVDGVETALRPYEAFNVRAGQIHSASPMGGEAVLMNISVPPLSADDQIPMPGERERVGLAGKTG